MPRNYVKKGRGGVKKVEGKKNDSRARSIPQSPKASAAKSPKKGAKPKAKPKKDVEETKEKVKEKSESEAVERQKSEKPASPKSPQKSPKTPSKAAKETKATGSVKRPKEQARKLSESKSIEPLVTKKELTQATQKKHKIAEELLAVEKQVFCAHPLFGYSSENLFLFSLAKNLLKGSGSQPQKQQA